MASNCVHPAILLRDHTFREIFGSVYSELAAQQKALALEEKFEKKTYVGKIVSIDYEIKCYRVLYTDNDAEDISMKEFEKFVADDEKEEMRKLLNRNVKKKFGSRWYNGTVVSINFAEKMYTVLYSDDDMEVYNKPQLQEILVQIKRLKKTNARKRKKG